MNKQYYGDEAVAAAAQHYGYRGPIDPIARHIIHEEGFVAGQYDDHKGIATSGVGIADPELQDKNFFTEVLPIYTERARKATKDYVKLPESAQAAVVSMAYRGDWGPNTKKALAAGNLRAAARQYLDHDEYRKGRYKHATPQERAVAERMLRNARALDPKVAM